MLPELNLPSNPTCGVIVSKSGEDEVVCGLPASQLVSMVDPETKSKVSAILLVCEKHDKELEAGKELIFLSDDGTDHILVHYQQGGKL